MKNTRLLLLISVAIICISVLVALGSVYVNPQQPESMPETVALKMEEALVATSSPMEVVPSKESTAKPTKTEEVTSSAAPKPAVTTPPIPEKVVCGDTMEDMALDIASCPARVQELYTNTSITGCSIRDVGFENGIAQVVDVVERFECSDYQEATTDLYSRIVMMQNGNILSEYAYRAPQFPFFTFNDGQAIDTALGFDFYYGPNAIHHSVFGASVPLLNNESFLKEAYYKKTDGTLCRKDTLLYPLSGFVEKCASNPVTVTFSYAPGVLPWPEAETAARSALAKHHSRIQSVKDYPEAYPYVELNAKGALDSWRTVLRTYEDEGNEFNYSVSVSMDGTTSIEQMR